jgi:DNA-binding LacI/PurR family transcriptional regulator/DNA-binding transcriptional regulator YhcF (GntR family)
MRLSKPAQDKATAFVRQLLTARGEDRGGSMPSIRRLAANAGVSYVSMWKAVGQLRQQGLVRVNHRTGIGPLAILPPRVVMGAAVPRASAPRQKWAQVSARLEHDILTGRFLPGARFPSVKELTRQYGACHDTIRKALERLVSERWLAVERRGYRVPLLHEANRAGTVVVVASGDRSGAPALFTNRSQDHYRLLEGECARSGVSLSVVTCNSAGELLHVPREAELIRGGVEGPVPVLGYMFWTVGVASEPVLSALVSRCVRSGKPVAVLDETGGNVPVSAAQSSLRRFCCAGSERCGYLAGRYLLGRGHRNVAYISPLHALEWSVNRLRGLARAFDEAGFGGQVTAFTVDGTFAPQRSLPRGLESAAEALVGGTSPSDESGRALLLRALRVAWPQVEVTMNHLVLGQVLEGLLDSALACRGPTAWVAANDGIALDTIAYLHRNGRQVPEDLSVIGFDDTLEAFQHGLTSFNFNAPALMHAMLGYLLASREPDRRPQEARAVEIDGFVTTRQTVASAVGQVAR